MAREKGLEPKKPREADSGEGWADSIVATPGMSRFRFCAWRPHKIATSGPPRLTSERIAWSVIASQPLLACEPGFPGATDRHLLRSIRPRAKVAMFCRWKSHVLEQLAVDINK